MEYTNLILMVITYFHAFISDSNCYKLKAYDKYKKIDLDTNFESECVCFDNNPNVKPLTQILDPSRAGLERIVILLYRDSQGKIQLLIPSLKKQLLIPDIQVDEEDALLTITTETLNSVFNHKDNILNIHPFTSKKQDQLDTVSQPNYIPGIEGSTEIDIDYVTSSYKTSDPYDEAPENANAQKPSHQENYPYVPPSDKNQLKPSNQIDPLDDAKQLLIDDIDATIPPVNIPGILPVEKPKQISPILYPHLPSKYPKNNNIEINNDIYYPQNETKKNLEILIDYKPSSINDDNTIIEYLPSNKDVSDPDHLNKDVIDQLVPATRPIDKTLSDDSLVDSVEINIPNIDSSVELPSVDIIFNPSTVNQQSTTGLIFNPHKKQNKSSNAMISDVTFSEWFATQMKNIESGTSLLNTPLDIETLEILIQQALLEHGLYVSEGGVLTNFNGQQLNMSNLFLRPLLIGELMPYIALRSKTNKTVVFSENSSYLESVLITLLYPPKIIGIIPIGKLIIPNMSDQGQISLNPYKNHNSKAKINNYFVSQSSKEQKTKSTFVKKKKSRYFITQLQNVKNLMAQKKSRGRLFTSSRSGKGRRRPKFTNSRRSFFSNKIKSDMPPEIEKVINELNLSDAVKNKLRKMLKIENSTTISNKNSALQRLYKNSDDIKLERVINELLATLGQIKGVDANTQRRVSEQQGEKNNLLKELHKALLKIKKPSYATEERTSFGSSQMLPNEEEYVNEQTFLNSLRNSLSYLRGLPKDVIEKLKDLISKIHQLEAEKDEDKPEFRIIGGAAATGSGAPLSNRGRSGYITV